MDKLKDVKLVGFTHDSLPAAKPTDTLVSKAQAQKDKAQKGDKKQTAMPSQQELKGLRQAASRPKFCKFYAEGKCSAGSNCPDPHLNKGAINAITAARTNAMAAKTERAKTPTK